MADIDKVSGVAWADVGKMNAIDGADIAKVGGAGAPPGGTVCWVAVTTVGRVMYSTSPTAASGSWSAIYQTPDAGTTPTGIAFGKNHLGADQWIITWDRGDNAASIAVASVPTGSDSWTTFDLDAHGTWEGSKAPNGVAYSNGPAIPVWAIVGPSGHVAYSSTGSTDPDDWAVDVNTTTGFAGNRGIEGVAFSGSHMFLAGARTRIVSGAVAAEPTATNISWDTSDLCLDENDAVGSSQMNWYNLAIAGTGSGVRAWAIADSSRATNMPVFATGSHMCCGDFDATGSHVHGWRDIMGYPAGTFGDNTDANSRRMRGVEGDGVGNWMIVGLRAQAFKSTDNGASWATISNLPDNPNGQTVGNTDFHGVVYASVGGTSTWVIHGEDGYMAVTTDFGANWTAIDQPFSAAGTGVNYHVYRMAFSAIRPWPGASNLIG